MGDPPEASLLVLVLSPMVVPEEQRRAVAEAISRAARYRVGAARRGLHAQLGGQRPERLD